MKITQVRFPCGRIGLEVETLHYGYSETTPSYAYYYNGESYNRDFAKKAGITLVYDYYGQMQGLVRVNKHNIAVLDLIRLASSNWMEPTTERPLT